MENVFCYTGEDDLDYVVYVVPSPFYKNNDAADYCSLCVWLIPGQNEKGGEFLWLIP